MTGRCLLLIGLLVAAPALAAPRSSRVVARVNKVEISERRLLSEMMQRLPFLSFHQRFSDEMMLKLKKQTLEQVIEEELLFQEARARGLAASKAEVSKAKAQQIAAAGGADKFAKKMAGWHMTWPDIWSSLERRLAARALLQREVFGPAAVSDAEIRAHYDKDPSRFQRPPEVKLQQLLIRVKPEEPASAWDKARGSAESVVAALDRGADFDKTVQRVNKNHAAGLRGGEMGWVHQGRLLPELDRVAFALKKGQHSRPLRTLHGYVVIRVLDRRAGEQLTLAQAAPKIKKRLFSDRVKERREQLLQRLRSKSKIERLPGGPVR